MTKKYIKKDKTPLHLAAEKGDLCLTVYILNKGADINAQDESGWTPLHWAVYSGEINIVRFLIGQGADYNITDGEGSPVYYAFEYGHVKLVKYFIEVLGIDPMTVTECGTLFDRASVSGDLDTIEYLMNQDDVIYDCNDLLERAVRYGHLDVVEHLVKEEGVDVNFADENGWTPLLHAVERDELNVAWYLIEMGANVNTITEDGTTGLHIAAEYCSFNIVRCLIENGAKINVRDKEGNTPLRLTIRDSEVQDKRYKEDVKGYLISRGAHI